MKLVSAVGVRFLWLVIVVVVPVRTTNGVASTPRRVGAGSTPAAGDCGAVCCSSGCRGVFLSASSGVGVASTAPRDLLGPERRWDLRWSVFHLRRDQGAA